MKNIFLSFLIIASSLACEKEAINPTESLLNVPVVESYLIVGQPITVKISQQIPFGASDTSAVSLGDLQPSISVNGEIYFLEETAEGIYESDSTLIVEAEQTYRLSFEYQSATISATTTAPERPINFSATSNSIQFDTQSFPPTFPDPLELSWKNEDASFYQVSVRNVEANPVELSFGGGGGGGGERPGFAVTPEQISTYELRPRTFEFLGTHRVVLHRVDAEYVAFATSSVDAESQNIATPYTNIEGGLGIFTATATDTLFVEVKD